MTVALFLGLILGAVCLWVNYRRPQLSRDEELIPNQLLTTYPVVFLSGRKSLFYFLNYWNQLPERLKDHGYEVEEWTLPWRSTPLIRRRLRQRLEEQHKSGRPLHLFADSSLKRILLELSREGHPAVQSLNLIGHREIDTADTALRPPRLPVRVHFLPRPLQSPPLSRWLTRLHRWLMRNPDFEPEVIGLTRDQRRLESFYLNLLSELAALDLKS
jgi:hypothetical protein